MIRLPIEFFEQVPSGVLLKHMQQTEKIRGFLSGNLFFTILDMFSLLIFIPFLLLYSVKLTCVVLCFTLLMAFVIALLIKPFQRRLNALYQAEGQRQSRLVEAIHGIRTVKSLALEPLEEKGVGESERRCDQGIFFCWPNLVDCSQLEPGIGDVDDDFDHLAGRLDGLQGILVDRSFDCVPDVGWPCDWSFGQDGWLDSRVPADCVVGTHVGRCHEYAGRTQHGTCPSALEG